MQCVGTNCRGAESADLPRVERKSASARSCDDYEVRRRAGSHVCWATHTPHGACPRSCERKLQDTLDAGTTSSRICCLRYSNLPCAEGGWVRLAFPIPATQKRAGAQTL